MKYCGKKPEKNITKTFRKEEEERLEIIHVTLKNWNLVFLQDHVDFGTTKFQGNPRVLKDSLNWFPNVFCFVKPVAILIDKSINWINHFIGKIL